MSNEESSREKAPIVVFVDADNTLWGTDAVYAKSQDALLARVEEAVNATVHAPDRLLFIRHIDQALAERHHLGLKYPPELLVQATAHALTGHPVERSATLALRSSSRNLLSPEVASEIADRFLQELKSTPLVLPGVIEGLKELRQAGSTIFVLTEGHKRRIEATARELNISPMIDGIIEGQKRPELFKRVLKLVGSPSDAFMIGDQIARDIAPARLAGLKTVYTPSGFRPRWEAMESRDTIDIECSRFDEAVAQILRVIGQPKAHFPSLSGEAHS